MRKSHPSRRLPITRYQRINQIFVLVSYLLTSITEDVTEVE
jgi:hypothetical protein